MKTLLIIAAFVSLAGCEAPGRPVAREGISGERIGTIDGCAIYRFADGMNLHYFARCPNAQATTMSTVGTAKAHREEEVTAQ